MRIWIVGFGLTLSAIACGPSPQGRPAEDEASAANGQSPGPPTGALGFDFGAAPTDVKRACKGAGKTWTSYNNESGTCSGRVAEFGFDATVRVDFCNKRSCVIALEHRPNAKWLATFNDVRAKLAKRHGTPALMPTKGIPEKCRTEEQYAQCLESEELQLKFRWEWPTRHQITLTIGKPEGEAGPSAIRIKYVTPPTI
jgi:hypothetical protein